MIQWCAAIREMLFVARAKGELMTDTMSVLTGMHIEFWA